MRAVSLLAALLLAAAMVGAVDDPANLEVVSSYFADEPNDKDYPTSHEHHDSLSDIIGALHQKSTEPTNLRGLQQLRCSASQQLVQLTLLTDDSPADTSWTLETNSGGLIASSPSSGGSNAYDGRTGYQTKYCLDVGTEYTFTIKDKTGDGLQTNNNNGFYKIAVQTTSSGWKILASGGDFTYKSIETFSITSNGGKLLTSTGTSGNVPSASSEPVYAPVPTPSNNYAHQSSNNKTPSGSLPSKPSFQGTGAMIEQFGPVQAQTFSSRMGCPENHRKARVEIQLDNFGRETSWRFKSDTNGKVYMRNSRRYEKNDYEVVEKCLPEDTYKMIVYDDSGDGICCQSGRGYYVFYLETDGRWEEIYRGGKFKSKKDAQTIKIGPVYMNDRDEEWLTAHNTRRKKYHGQYGTKYVPLKWSEGLKEAAASYAEELLSSCPSPTIVHDPNTSYGENLAKNRGVNGWGDLKPADNILNRFVERELDDPWPHNSHLTQALWRATRYVGCAESVKPLGQGMCRIQVCRYAKAGNCNVRKNVKNDWYNKMVAKESECDPICPPEGCF